MKGLVKQGDSHPANPGICNLMHQADKLASDLSGINIAADAPETPRLMQQALMVRCLTKA